MVRRHCAGQPGAGRRPVREAEQLIDQALGSVGRAQGVAPQQAHALQRLLLERDIGQPEMSVERLRSRDLTALGGTLRIAALCLALVSSGDLDGAAETTGRSPTQSSRPFRATSTG